MTDPLDLARLFGPPPATAQLRTAVVATVAPLTIYVAASTVAVPARKLDDYAPVAGHQVAVLEQGPDLLVLGSLAATTAPAWIAYTPTLTNVALGNGTLTGYYEKVGRRVTWGARLQFGSTTSVTGGILLTVPPVAPHARYAVNANAGLVSAHDSGVAVYAGKAIFTSLAGQVVLTNQGSPQSAYTATVPFTWGTADEFWVDGWYEAAT